MKYLLNMIIILFSASSLWAGSYVEPDPYFDTTKSIGANIDSLEFEKSKVKFEQLLNEQNLSILELEKLHVALLELSEQQEDFPDLDFEFPYLSRKTDKIFDFIKEQYKTLDRVAYWALVDLAINRTRIKITKMQQGINNNKN